MTKLPRITYLTNPENLEFPKNLIAQGASALLSYLAARHQDTWELAYGRGKAAGNSEGFRLGYETGKRHGALEGYGEGHVDGFSVGRTELLIRDAREKVGVRTGVDDFLFDAWAFQLSDEVVGKFRSDVARLLPKHKWPTEHQWEMILATTPSTYVVAGAGSGKTTTLILRLVLLRKYLGYEWGSMTVVTFTKKSQQEFVERLLVIASLFGIEDIDSDVAEIVVCTFHSKILKFARLLSSSRIKAFEFHGKSEDELKRSAGDSPFDTRINQDQRQLLNECYEELYESDPRFRELIGALYRDSLTIEMLNADSEQAKRRRTALKSISERDAEVMDLVEAAWRAAGKWPLKGVSAKRETVDLLGRSFQIHGRIEGNEEIAVVLQPDTIMGTEVARPGSSYSLSNEMYGKKLLFSEYGNMKVVWLDKAADMENYLRWCADGATVAPPFNFQLKGDLGTSPLVDCFVNAATFMENLNLCVTDAIEKMRFPRGDCGKRFFDALAIFWPAFVRKLESHTPRLMTFNRMFACFGEGSEENLRAVPDRLLRSMSHLMIDEFQDVSPQIVSWIRAVLGEVRRRGRSLSLNRAAKHSSLLCVGDDWQSIYAWRGSSPKYFVEFPGEFKSSSYTLVKLRANFRSHQLIVNAAEHLVQEVESIEDKKAEARGKAAPVPVRVMDHDYSKVAELANAHYDSGDDVMVLYREGGEEEKKRIKKALGKVLEKDRILDRKKRRLRIMTIHKSKGLEADTVFILGDCKFKTSSPYKNQAYKQAGLGRKNDPEPFDSAQEEELYRLAYVAVTRAARHCYWFIPVDKYASQNPRASSRVAGCVHFQDERRIR